MSTHLIWVNPHYITHLGPRGTPSQPPNGQKRAQKRHVFPCRYHKWVVWARPIVKSRMQSLCHVNPSHLGQPTLYHPSGTQGDPLPAPKRPETRPKTTRFPNRVVGDAVGGVDNASSPPTTFNPAQNIPIPPYQNTLPPLSKLQTSKKLIIFLSRLFSVF